MTMTPPLEGEGEQHGRTSPCPTGPFTSPSRAVPHGGLGRRHGYRVALALVTPSFLLLYGCSAGSPATTDGQGADIPRADLSFSEAVDSRSPQCVQAANRSDFRWIQDTILTTSCANQLACHQNGTQAEHLDLRDGNAYAALLSTRSEQEPAMRHVVPGNAPESYLLVKMASETQAVGVSMPFGRRLLCRQQLQAVQRWIERGAAP